MSAVNLRDGEPADARLLAAIHMQARAVAMPQLPVLHDRAATERFYRDVVIATQRVAVAELDGAPAALMATTPGWIEHLYVAPQAWRRGLGSRLVRLAQSEASELTLWTFQMNRAARQFYAAMGFAEVELTDGQNNEERTPDVRLSWQRERG